MIFQAQKISPRIIGHPSILPQPPGKRHQRRPLLLSIKGWDLKRAISREAWRQHGISLTQWLYCSFIDNNEIHQVTSKHHTPYASLVDYKYENYKKHTHSSDHNCGRIPANKRSIWNICFWKNNNGSGGQKRYSPNGHWPTSTDKCRRRIFWKKNRIRNAWTRISVRQK